MKGEPAEEETSEGEPAEGDEGEPAEGEEEEASEEDEDSEGLPFAKAEVVRLMKQNLDSDKMIRERVKVEMNRFLGDVLENVCEQLNEYPYTTIEYEMLKESIYPYKNIKRINEEKLRLLKHMDAIKADCDALSMDIQRTLKLKDVDEDKDEFFQ
ncbi:hypothetical protein [Methanobacterium aggregans]|uniref:hypothetical protein n=1 Tax=Methanobacterium aggregans TaxID=1615586 RepID=UPI003D275F87